MKNVPKLIFVFFILVGIAFSQNSRQVKSTSLKGVSSSSEMSKMERLAFDLVNQKRLEKGLESLIWNEIAAKTARLHSANMATYSFFSHEGLDNSSVADRADFFGLKRRDIGENIAFNQGIQNPVEFAVKQWTKSSTHRKNLLDKCWTEGAIGIAKSADNTYYFTEVFINR